MDDYIQDHTPHNNFGDISEFLFFLSFYLITCAYDTVYRRLDKLN